MKLINAFFFVLDTTGNGTGCISTIEINPNHIIYAGHFPGHPVTPGVIQIQMVHELLEMHLGNKLKLITMSGCKFLKVINPNEISQLVVHINFNKEGELIKVKAWGEKGTDIFFKLNSIYQVA